jgi:putative heme-binding domain-containing protein
VQAAALRLLDQPPRAPGLLSASAVVARASALDDTIRSAALWVLMRHPEWSGAALEHIRRELDPENAGADRLEGLANLMLAFQEQGDIQELLASMPGSLSQSIANRVWALETIGQTHLAPLPKSWIEAIVRAIRDEIPEVRQTAVRIASRLDLQEADAPLIKLADDPTQPAELRLEALRATLHRNPEPSPAAFKLLLEQLGETDSPLTVLAAGEVVAKTKLDDTRRIRLIDRAMKNALLTPTMIAEVFKPPIGESAALRWADYLEAALASGWKPSESALSVALDSIPSLSQERRRAILALGMQNMNARRAHLSSYESLLTGGDPGRGRQVFFGNTAVACASCHRVGQQGGEVGPDLTRIGAIRSGHDLLESIVLPSSTFAQGYESYSVATHDGRVVNGTIARQDSQMILLRDSSGALTRLPRASIAEIQRAEVSQMPDGIAATLTREQLRDLLAFLRSMR